MTNRVALAFALSCGLSNAISAQAGPQTAILVSSCPSADSLLGPRSSASPLVLRGAPFAGGEIRVGVPTAPANLRYGDPSLNATISAYPSPLSKAPLPAELLLTLSGDPAKQLSGMEQPVHAVLRFKADTTDLLGTFPTVTGSPSQGMALAFVSFPLVPDLVARIVSAKDVRLEFNRTKIDLSKDLRRQLGDAYRASLCGYQPTH